ncbi:aldehyde dehydrogenase [Desulfitobacterium sp. PCE1]|uniref:aldehyde dehydrogenase n=1 Tax=Desulfitobacterium sp. PCE1 TaxID=146907 RepID=UPI0003769A2D|nr:aldehyde dehydrogenase [Desulfitobacterium sp. PCE1]
MKDTAQILEKQRLYFAGGETLKRDFRKKQLLVLQKAVQESETAIMTALQKDLNKSSFEGYATEIGIVLEELRFMLKNLDRFTRPRRVRTPLAHFLSTSTVYQEPYGVVLIMSPWNYPFQLTMAPLIGAIAAGNCALVKPSAYSPHTSAVIQKIIGECFDERYVAVVEGGREVNQALLEERFDYIFFTGSVAIGKLVMGAAARHLTPVTLELGGKSPCIVDETAHLALAGRRIAWGKYLNAGQTCVAPDYVLVHKSKKEALIEEIRKSIRQFYGEEPHHNRDYPKIINEKHFDRLLGLMNSGIVAAGGRFNRETRQIEPTVLDAVAWDSPVMQEEIFGPILPVLEFEEVSEVIGLVNARPKPLALYLFTTSAAHEEEVLSRISFGGGCINDTVVHLATSHMAFGGVGESGMGGYHGEASIRTFSHSKSILKKSNLLDVPLRYPPFKNHLSLLKKIMK